MVLLRIGSSCEREALESLVLPWEEDSWEEVAEFLEDNQQGQLLALAQAGQVPWNTLQNDHLATLGFPS